MQLPVQSMQEIKTCRWIMFERSVNHQFTTISLLTNIACSKSAKDHNECCLLDFKFEVVVLC